MQCHNIKDLGIKDDLEAVGIQKETLKNGEADAHNVFVGLVEENTIHNIGNKTRADNRIGQFSVTSEFEKDTQRSVEDLSVLLLVCKHLDEIV